MECVPSHQEHDVGRGDKNYIFDAGGNNNDHDLTVNITPDGQSAQWLCFRASCGFKGGVTVGSSPAPAKLQTGAPLCDAA